MENDSVRHHPETIVNHSIARQGFASTLELLCERDSHGKGYFKGTVIPALDLDAFETKRTGKGNNECTVDAVVGVCTRRRQKYILHRLLMVELRTNYGSADNLSIKKIAKKESHSRQLLTACPDNIPIDHHVCLVFKPSVEAEAVNWLARYRKEDDRLVYWEVYSPDTFCNYINYFTREPFIPKPETTDIINRFKAILESNEPARIDSEWETSRRYLEMCRLRYELEEASYLSEQISNAITEHKLPEDIDEEDAEYINLIFEDITKILR